MAAGKTSVGRALAHATSRRFVDLDDVIAAAGEPVAELVARDEAEFRRREASALAGVIAAAGDGPVVATGGGAAAHGDNLARMRAAGCVVALGVDPDRAIARAGDAAARPLLARAHELAAARAPVLPPRTRGRRHERSRDRGRRRERARGRARVGGPRRRRRSSRSASAATPIEIVDGWRGTPELANVARSVALITDRERRTSPPGLAGPARLASIVRSSRARRASRSPTYSGCARSSSRTGSIVPPRSSRSAAASSAISPASSPRRCFAASRSCSCRRRWSR